MVEGQGGGMLRLTMEMAKRKGKEDSLPGRGGDMESALEGVCPQSIMDEKLY